MNQLRSILASACSASSAVQARVRYGRALILAAQLPQTGAVAAALQAAQVALRARGVL